MIPGALSETMAWKEISAIIIAAVVIILALPTVSASSASLSDLKSSISGFDDPRMNVEDLAFYLATHGFDATPGNGNVEVELSGKVYKLIPNGSAPGLASITA
jgi:hypothetical protein